MSDRRILIFAGLVVTLGACGPDTPDGEPSQLFINEFMPSNNTSHPDTEQTPPEFDDWIEIYNAGEQEIDLEGYYISDDKADYFKKRLSTGLKIPAGGFLLLWADGEPSQGNNHLPFKLKAAGEEIYLTSPDEVLLDGIEYELAAPDTAFARFPDGTGEYIFCASATPGAKNGEACGG